MKKQLVADICLLLVTLIWGTTFVIVQNAIAILPPFAFNGIRFLIAATLLFLWLILFERKQLSALNPKLFMSGIIIGIWLFIGYASQTLGLLYTTSSKAGFITGLSVVLVPLFSIILLKQKPSKNAVVGVLIATVGLYLLTMSDMASLNIGDALVLICAVGFAMQIIVTGKYSGLYPSLLLTVVQIGTVGVLSTISAFLFEDWKMAFKPDTFLQPEVFFALLITSVFATALAFLAQTNFQKFTTPTRVALIFAMEPVFAAVTAYVWAHERLSYIAVLGCLFIFAGMIFSEMPAKKFFLTRKMKGNRTV